MVRNKLAAAILSAGLALPGLASALGVGEYTLKSYLNQPLALEITLLQTKDLTVEEVVATLASQEAFEQAGVDRVFFLQDIRFEVEQRNGNMVIVARTSKPVNEPFLNFLMDVQWPQGRLLREYTILLDPPVFKTGDAPTATAEPVTVSEPEPVTTTEAALPAITPVEEPVIVVDSDLPPPPSGTVASPTYEEPAAPAQEPAPSRPAPVAQEGDYRVQANDTLWQIAAQHRGSGTVQQTMIAIQRANPEAFIQGNVNLVKKGAVLRIPGEAEVQQVSTSEANAEFASQTRAWRELLDQRGVVLPSDSATLEAGKTAGTRPAAPKSTGKGEVTLVAPSASGKGAKAGSGKEVEALQNQLAIAEEGLDKAARENKELASRLGDLDKQVKASEKLLAMKNDQIAGLQDELKKLRKEKGLPAAAEEPKPAEVPEEPAVAEAAPAEEPVKPAAEKPKKKPKPEPVVEEAPPPAPEGNSLLVPIAGGVALLAALGGGLWFMRRQKAAAPAAAQSYAEESHDAQVADDLAQLQDLNLGGSSDDDVTTIAAGGDGDSSGDPLGEADMYMAYGRFQQAADILYAALQREPERDDIRVKLAEVYAEMGDTDSAREQASSVASSGSDDVRRQAAAVLAKTGGGAAGGGSEAAEEALPSLDDLALEFSGGKQESAVDELSFDLDEPAPAAKTAKTAAIPAAAPKTAKAPAVSAPEPADDLEFSLDDLDMAEPASTSSTTEVRSKQALDDALSLEDSSLDDFSFEEAKPAAVAEEFSLDEELSFDAPAEELSLEAAEEELDFNATSGVQAKLTDDVIEAAVAAPVPAAVDLESELADLQSDLKDEGVSASGNGGDDFDFLADSDENATKLDLAKAYIDMGDADGARDILNEVVAEGTAAQKSEAQKLLAQVG
ncbi:MAG: FimV/HubP family polar landmark protein [Pseudomonadota bacterium]